MEINRILLKELQSPVNPQTNKVILLLGTRLSGKTYLLQKIVTSQILYFQNAY